MGRQKKMLIRAVAVMAVILSAGCGNQKKNDTKTQETSKQEELKREEKVTPEETKSDTKITPVEQTPAPTTEVTVEPEESPDIETDQNASEEADRWNEVVQMASEWSRAFCRRETFSLGYMYPKEGMLDPAERYEQLAEELFAGFQEDDIMAKKNCTYNYGEDTVEIQYYVQKNDVTAAVLRQTLHFAVMEGSVVITKVDQKLYDQVKNAKQYKAAYIINEAPAYYDFFDNLVDQKMKKSKKKVYQNPGTAAEAELNLVQGKVEKVDYEDVATSTYDEAKTYTAKKQAAKVHYQFKDGSKVTIDMYQTGDGIWLPGESEINADFKRWTKEDYKKAADIRKDEDCEITQDHDLYLMAASKKTKVYGTSDNYVIVEQDGRFRPYDIPWYSMQGRKTDVALADYDEDGEEEIACSAHLGTGTGVNLDTLYVLDRNKGKWFEAYEYTDGDYQNDLGYRFTYIYNKESDEVTYYVNGHSIRPSFQLHQRPELESLPDATLNTVRFGNLVTFDVGKTIQMNAELECYVKNVPTAVFVNGTLSACVDYYGDGNFTVKDVLLENYEGMEPKKSKGLMSFDHGVQKDIDINGDGIEETVGYNRVPVTPDEPYDTTPFLQVDDMVYGKQALEELGIYFEIGDTGKWYLIDVDPSDSYIEIALYDSGPSEDPVTYFLRYDGKHLKYCGCIPDCPDYDSFCVNGDGIITSSKRLDILQTWYAETKWKMSAKGKIKEIPPKMFATDLWKQDYVTRNILKQDVKFYKTQNRKGETVELKKGTQIDLIATDNKHWVELTTKDWETAWMYVEDYNTLCLPDGKKNALDIMSYLCYAD